MEVDEINHAAQTPKQIKSFDHVLGHRYTISDGLAGMHVEDIYQDRQGLLWIATAYSDFTPFTYGKELSCCLFSFVHGLCC